MNEQNRKAVAHENNGSLEAAAKLESDALFLAGGPVLPRLRDHDNFINETEDFLVFNADTQDTPSINWDDFLLAHADSLEKVSLYNEETIEEQTESFSPIFEDTDRHSIPSEENWKKHRLLPEEDDELLPRIENDSAAIDSIKQQTSERMEDNIQSDFSRLNSELASALSPPTAQTPFVVNPILQEKLNSRYQPPSGNQPLPPLPQATAPDPLLSAAFGYHAKKNNTHKTEATPPEKHPIKPNSGIGFQAPYLPRVENNNNGKQRLLYSIQKRITTITRLIFSPFTGFIIAISIMAFAFCYSTSTRLFIKSNLTIISPLVWTANQVEKYRLDQWSDYIVKLIEYQILRFYINTYNYIRHSDVQQTANTAVQTNSNQPLATTAYRTDLPNSTKAMGAAPQPSVRKKIPQGKNSIKRPSEH
ncbi:MAG: hypothetical protein ACOYK8_09660 [Alphaproteobacteria bacterium]